MPAFVGARDLALRARHDQLPPGGPLAAAVAERTAQVAALVEARVRTGDLADAAAERVRCGEPAERDLAAVVVAAYRYLARSRARLIADSLEDAVGVVEQSNVPGTVTEHPNWRRRLPVALEAVPRDRRFVAARAVADRPATGRRRTEFAPQALNIAA